MLCCDSSQRCLLCVSRLLTPSALVAAADVFPQLGRTLVFETLDQAAAYRACVVNSLKTSTADIVTLDGSKLSGRGVVVGSNFRVCPIQEAPFRFGSRPAGELQVGAASAACDAFCKIASMWCMCLSLRYNLA